MPYNPSVRKFALVLSCKSKSGYRWVRQKFANHLPSIRTIQSWHSNSSCNFECGFNNQTISTLSKLTAQEKLKGNELYVTMCHDEVFIRRHIHWNHNQKRYNGLVTYGRRDDDEIPVANNAIFFLINIIQTGQSLILAYFLIKSLDGDEKARLLKDVIAKVNSTGAYLLSMSFDGLGSNFIFLILQI